MDISIAVALLLHVGGAKFALDGLRLLRSPELRAVEDKIVFHKKWAPTTKTQSRRFTFILGLCIYVLAWWNYFSPKYPPFTGRSAWLYSVIYQYLGTNGLVLWWVIVGTTILFSVSKTEKA